MDAVTAALLAFCTGLVVAGQKIGIGAAGLGIVAAALSHVFSGERAFKLVAGATLGILGILAILMLVSTIVKGAASLLPAGG